MNLIELKCEKCHTVFVDTVKESAVYLCPECGGRARKHDYNPDEDEQEVR